MNNLANKIIPISLILIFLGATIIYFISDNSDNKMQIEPMNYRAWISSGLAPIANSRVVTDKDIDTQLVANTPQGVYHLYESRNWNTNDYGKLFVVKEG